MSASLDFKGRRLALANAFRGWSTANEAANDLGAETGSVFGLIRRMHAEGILEAESDPDPPTRGTQYRLTHEARVALEDVDKDLADEDELGSLTEGQRLVIARGEALTGAQAVLSAPTLSSTISWAAWLGGSWLIAMRRDSDGHAWRRLTTALEAEGFQCERGRVDEVQTARELRRQSASNLHLVEMSK